MKFPFFGAYLVSGKGNLKEEPSPKKSGRFLSLLLGGLGSL